MKSLLRLRPYLAKYKRTLLWGICTVIVSNLFMVATPLFIGNAFDDPLEYSARFLFGGHGVLFCSIATS